MGHCYEVMLDMARIEFSSPEAEAEFAKEFTEERPVLGWRDMLLPARLLDETKWRFDPLVIYGELRSRRLPRFIAIRAFEAVILAIAICTIVMGFKLWFGLPIVTFLIIRYHLYVNDQSMFIKALSRNRLEELMVTRLSDNEFFLHQFLIFCQSYRLVYGFLVMTLLFCLPARDESFIHLLYLFILMMQAWIAGVYQFTVEWKHFAGGRLNKLRGVISIIISLALVGLIQVVDWATIRALDMMHQEFSAYFLLFLEPLAFVATWVGAFALTFREGDKINKSATKRLRSRLDPEFGVSRYALRGFDFLFPWRWANPFKNRAKSLNSINRMGSLEDAVFYGAVFSILLMICNMVGDRLAESRWIMVPFTTWISTRFREAGLVFVIAAVGIYQGLLLAKGKRPVAAPRMNQALFWIGISTVAITVVPAGYELFGHVRVSAMAVIHGYIVNIAYGLAALACGVLIAERPRRLLIILLAAIGILFTQLLTFLFFGFVLAILWKYIRLQPYGSYPVFAEIIGICMSLASYLIVFMVARTILKRLWAEPDEDDENDQLLEISKV